LRQSTPSCATGRNQSTVEDEFTVDEAIRCLEMQIGRPPNEKRVIVPTEEWVLFLDLSSLGIKCGENLY
jgi:hypothetical protein